MASQTASASEISPDPRSEGRSRSGEPQNRIAVRVIFLLLTFQIVSAGFFLAELWGEVLGFRSQPLPWYVAEAAQVLASVGLIAGVIVTAIFLRRSQARIARLDQQIEAVSGDFEEHLNKLFKDWSLSASEAEIAIYAMKGFSNAEIGSLRGTSVATVKSQMNAIYRKTGLANRQQLIAFLVEELLNGVGAERPLVPAA